MEILARGVLGLCVPGVPVVTLETPGIVTCDTSNYALPSVQYFVQSPRNAFQDVYAVYMPHMLQDSIINTRGTHHFADCRIFAKFARVADKYLLLQVR